MGTRRRFVSALCSTVVASAALVGGVVPVVAVRSVAAVSGPVDRIPSKIKSDCSVDVTSSLRRWINSAPNGSVLRFGRGGCYRIDGSLTIDRRSHITLAGNGATLRAVTAGGRDRRHVWFRGGRDIVVRDLTVRGSNPHAGATPRAYVPGRAFQHGFAFQGVRGGVLDHVRVYDVYGDFVYIGPGTRGAWSRNIRIENSTFAGSGRQGISITAGDHVSIVDNDIRGVGRSLFDLEPNNAEQGAEHVTIAHNRTGGAANFWIASKGAGRHISFTVRKNTMEAKTGNLIWVYGPPTGFRGPVVIEENRLEVGGTVNDESSTGAFFFTRVNGITIRDNGVIFPKGRRVPAVEIRDCMHLDVAGNSFRNAGRQILDTSADSPGSRGPTHPSSG
jgi:hypothetical protein